MWFGLILLLAHLAKAHHPKPVPPPHDSSLGTILIITTIILNILLSIHVLIQLYEYLRPKLALTDKPEVQISKSLISYLAAIPRIITDKAATLHASLSTK